jgi:hypothetical protein
MSVLAIVLIVVGVLLAIFFAGGLVVARRRRDRPGWEKHIEEADRHLEAARASDRGWDRELLNAAAKRAVETERPGFNFESLDLVLVDDRPGVAEDRAHLLAAGPDGSVRVVLARDEAGEWGHERTA